MDTSKPVLYESVLERIGYGRCQITITLVGALCILCSFMLACVLPYVLPVAQCDLNLSSQDRGSLISAGFVGIIVSCHMWGFLSDTLGRRYILARCLLADGILYILNSFAPDFWFFFVIRLLNGISSCGGVVSAYAYVGEFHTKKNRNQSLLIAAIVAVNLYYILPGLCWLVYSLELNIPLFSGAIVFNSWRLFYAICGIPSLITSLWLFFLPESPKFLLARGRNAEAIEAIKWLYNKNTGKPGDEFTVGNIIVEDKLSCQLSAISGPKSISSVCKLISAQTAPLFRAPLKFSMVLICLLQYSLYFCNSGIMMWLPETMNQIAIFRHQYPGTPGTVCQAITSRYPYPQIVQRNTVRRNFMANNNNNTGSTTEDSMLYMFSTDSTIVHTTTVGTPPSSECVGKLDYSVFINTAVIGIVSDLLLIAMLLIMRVMRQKYVLGFCIFCALAATLSAIAVNYVDVLVLELAIVGLFTNVSIPVVTAATVELFPTNLRAMATCLSLMTGRLGTVSANQLAGALLYSHCNVVMYCYFGTLLLCLIFTAFLPSKAQFLEGVHTNNKEVNSWPA